MVLLENFEGLTPGLLRDRSRGRQGAALATVNPSGSPAIAALRGAALVIAFWLAKPALAGDGMLKEAASENRGFTLRFEPGNGNRACRAALFEERSGARKEVWERDLVNAVAPEQAFVRDDGKFVVTCGDYRRGGAQHAIVIYGADGILLRHWLLRDLLTQADWQHVRVERRSVNWLKDADFSWVDRNEFHIMLAWDRLIRIDLARLRIVDGAAEAADADIPAELLAALSDAGDSEPASAPVGGEAAAEGATPLDAVAGAEAEPVDVAQVLETLAAAVVAQSQPASEAAQATAENEQPPAAQPVADGRDDSEIKYASPSEYNYYMAPPAVAELGIQIPVPDPERPVNYLDWMNGRYRSDAGGIALVEAAIEEYEPWAGDTALYEAALRGDPEALRDPQIIAWRAQNQSALKKFRDWTLYDYNGIPLKSGDGSLIGALLPHLANMRNLAKASIIESRALIEESRVDEAMSLYMDNLQAGAQAGRGPTLIENLVGVAIQNTTHNSLLDLAASPAAAKVDFEDVAARLEFADAEPRPIAELIQSERAMVLDFLQRGFMPGIAGGRPLPIVPRLAEFLSVAGDSGPDVGALAKLATLDFDAVVANTNGYFDDVTAAARSPFPVAQKQFEALAETLQSSNADPLVAALSPAFERANASRARASATRRASLLVAKLMAHKQKFGEYPASLEVFGDSEFTVDPISGVSFSYQRDGDNFRLFAPGANQSDQGGLQGAGTDDEDIVFWPRPASKAR